MIVSLFILLSCTHTSETRRTPANIGDDSCKSAMTRLLWRTEGDTPEQFVDEIIDSNRLIDQGYLSVNDLHSIETSQQWHEFFLATDVQASTEEQLLVAALLKKADPNSPDEALQRKFNLLFEFCGL